MAGFFNQEQTGMTSQTSGQAECGRCKLKRGCLSPCMPPHGKGRQRVLVLAEAPGENEDQRGVQLIGEAGQLLRKELKKNGVDLDIDCVKTNAVCCRPPHNRTPTPMEIQACRPLVLQAIKEHQPTLILVLGGTAMKSLIGLRWEKDFSGISTWRGWHIPDQELKAWVCPVFHPSYILRQRKMFKGPQGVVCPAELLFQRDIAAAVEYIGQPVPSFEPDVRLISPEGAEELLEKLLAKETKVQVAFDYETTGLKPHVKGHRIAAASICYEANRSHAFQFTDSLIPLWKKFLTAKHLQKIGANIKFEQGWGQTLFGVRTSPWLFDTVLGAHVLDNRSSITSLKFQAYVRYGVMAYEKEVSPFLKAEASNGFNKVLEAPRKKLLTYCGMDALLTRRMAFDMMKEIGA